MSGVIRMIVLLKGSGEGFRVHFLSKLGVRLSRSVSSDLDGALRTTINRRLGTALETRTSKAVNPFISFQLGAN